VLDVVGEKNKLGKTPGKDSAAGKVTAPAIYGIEGARFRAQRYAQLAQKQFALLGKKFEILSHIVTYILKRTY
jgi:geranylgeranyl diphosphate synthase type II